MRFYNIFFSPTGGTEKVADIVAKGTKLDAEEIDLIKDPDKLMKVKLEKKDLCLVAVPSYGGRIPSVVTDMFRNRGNCKRILDIFWVVDERQVFVCKLIGKKELFYKGDENYLH